MLYNVQTRRFSTLKIRRCRCGSDRVVQNQLYFGCRTYASRDLSVKIVSYEIEKTEMFLCEINLVLKVILKSTYTQEKYENHVS